MTSLHRSLFLPVAVAATLALARCGGSTGGGSGGPGSYPTISGVSVSAWSSAAAAPGPLEHSGVAVAYDSARQRVVMFGGASDGPSPLDETWEWDGAAWSQRTPQTSPPGRVDAVMAYDVARQRVVLFGGGAALGSSPDFSDTWEWDGTSWENRTPASGPAASTTDAERGYAMAYDANRAHVLLVVSNRYAHTTQTWEWDGTSWLQLNPQVSPPEHEGHAMAFDSARGRLVLFGDMNLNDTWEFDGTTWAQQDPATSPSTRYGCSMGYDAERQRIVLFGGQVTSDTRTVLDETWEWDGATWAQLQPVVSPDARSASAMAYDEGHQRLVLFGGGAGVIGGSDTWQWDGSTWSRSALRAPSARTSPTIAFDEAHHLTVLFGGSEEPAEADFASTWTWDGSTWAQLSLDSSPAGRHVASMTYDSKRQRVVLFGGQIGNEDNSETWEWDGAAWSQQQPMISPQPRRSAGLAYDAARQRVVLFGGLSGDGNAAQLLQDTWEWDGTAWTQRAPDVAPPVRCYSQLAYDAARERIVLFGGFTALSASVNTAPSVGADTWAWDGTTWTQMQPATPPPARGGHSLTYDPVHQHVILFGGFVAGSEFSDVWEWDGKAWLQSSAPKPPSPRYLAGLTYDSDRQRLVMFGGDGPGSYDGLSDTWEASGAQ